MLYILSAVLIQRGWSVAESRVSVADVAVVVVAVVGGVGSCVQLHTICSYDNGRGYYYYIILYNIEVKIL